ncbi:MAG: hypothetical protein IKL80_00220 [Clostridia bacterium]|nr:hypothetical protein [Clostridia bacterium]
MRDRMYDYITVIAGKISKHQEKAIQCVFFTLGILFAFSFPKTAKRLRSLLAVCSLLLMLPSFCKYISQFCRDVKRLAP